MTATAVVLLTVASPHPAIVVGDSDEVIAAGPGVGVDQELGHVQVAAGTGHTVTLSRCGSGETVGRNLTVTKTTYRSGKSTRESSLSLM